MRLSDTLDAGAILIGVHFPDLDTVVAELVDRLTRCGRLPEPLRDAAVRSVLERERVSSTAMVDIGVSIPHSRLDGIGTIVSALAVSPTAVYGAAAGTPISIVALVLSPPALSGDHLNFLSALSILLHSRPLRTQIQHASDQEGALALIRANEAR